MRIVLVVVGICILSLGVLFFVSHLADRFCKGILKEIEGIPFETLRSRIDVPETQSKRRSAIFSADTKWSVKKSYKNRAETIPKSEVDEVEVEVRSTAYPMVPFTTWRIPWLSLGLWTHFSKSIDGAIGYPPPRGRA